LLPAGRAIAEKISPSPAPSGIEARVRQWLAHHLNTGRRRPNLLQPPFGIADGSSGVSAGSRKSLRSFGFGMSENYGTKFGRLGLDCRLREWSAMNFPKAITLRHTPSGIPVVRAHYSDHPERNAQWVESEKRKYASKAAWDREKEIVHEAGGGELV